MPSLLPLNHGAIPLPAFFPDATYGVVRCTDTGDLLSCRVPGLVMNGFHLMSKPGAGVLRQCKGIHNFSGWDGPVLTDSGGFQVFSLIRQNARFGEIRRNELVFRPDGGTGKVILTPEKSVQFQFACGSDIMMCLDYCTHPDDPDQINELAVEITIDWAARCKREYENQVTARKIPPQLRPLLFAIIQGGASRSLRKACAEELKAIGFDGYGFGGWPLSSDGTRMDDILAYTASLMPDNTVKYAMGLGKPNGIIACVGMGYTLFDCVVPTREARHRRLYVFDDFYGNDPEAYGPYYALDDRHIRDTKPVSKSCDCLCCRKHSRAYLHHLFKVGDSLAYRLATMHNLRFYSRLMELLRKKG